MASSLGARLMAAMRSAWYAGVTEWRGGEQDTTPWDRLQAAYLEKYLLARGELFVDVWRANPYKDDPRVYKNVALLWNHTARVISFWESTVYQGRLATTPGEGAIPVVPDPSLTDEQIANLMRVLGALYLKWNWQRKMRIRPRLAASLGDVLTELIDSPERRFVYPRVVPPWLVKELELDYADNVEAYAIEYQITEADATGAGETYTYRKEVDREAFRYFKDDKPFDYFGEGAVVPNVYGFVPAIWDRHTADDLNVRGMAATDSVRQALFGMNSLFSHARDFQHKAFLVPFIVTGTFSDETQVNLYPSTGVAADDASALATQLKYLEADEGTTVVYPQMDLGQTLAMLDKIERGILLNNPEAVFFDKLAEAQNVTGPGADRIILPVKGMVESVRDGMDPNTVHLLQMAITMGAMRVNSASRDWEYETTGSLRRRIELDTARKAFTPYTERSFDRGELAFTIGPRDIVLPSRAERIEHARSIESLQTLWAMRQADVSATDAEAILREKREAFAVGLNRGDFGLDYLDQQERDRAEGEA